VTKSNVIELNGRSYDALTGAMLGSAKRPEHRVRVAAIAAKQPPRAIKAPSQGVASMDGFVRAVHSTTGAAHHATTKKAASHISAHHPQPTKTLMRRAVKTPAITSGAKQPGIQAVTPLKPGLPSKLSAKPMVSSGFIDPVRSHRAALINRSRLVNHFTASRVAPQLVSKFATTPAATAAAPRQQPAYNHNPAMASGMANTRSVNRTTNPATSLGQKTPAALTAKAPAVAPHQTNAYEDQDIFEQALAHATSHQERPPKESTLRSAKRGGKKHRRVLGFAGAAVAFLLMCSFVAYQNKANIQLQVASAKAGFSASVPLYKPAGYNMGKLAYSPGNVAMVFHDSASNAGFNVSQKKSNWDSQTLLENFVATSNQPYQGYESGGRTIYVYGRGKATWVNGGVWYQIDGANNLSSAQIVKVAASM
jgi:hypothetical protein